MGMQTSVSSGWVVYITNKDYRVDLLVKNVEGPRMKREVDFEVLWGDRTEELHLSYTDGLYRLDDEIEFGVVPDAKPKPGFVTLLFEAPREYYIKKYEYKR